LSITARPHGDPAARCGSSTASGARARIFVRGELYPLHLLGPQDRGYGLVKLLPRLPDGGSARQRPLRSQHPYPGPPHVRPHHGRPRSETTLRRPCHVPTSRRSCRHARGADKAAGQFFPTYLVAFMRQNVPLLVKDASGLTMLDAEHPVDLAGNFVADPLARSVQENAWRF